MMNDWKWLDNIDCKKSSLSIHQTLYKQIESAIENGVLRAGDQLPTHRRLAEKLSIAVATVTKVYKLAEFNGLINARIGKGTFVSTCPVSPQEITATNIQCINLSIIKPQVSLGEFELQEQLQLLSQQNQLSDLMDYNTEGGSLTDLQTAKHWLDSQGLSLTNRDVSICSGAQHGLMLLINTLTEVGDAIAVERLCYPGIIALANQFGRKLIPIDIDEEGMIPSVLDNAIDSNNIKLVIVVASHQNPTTSVMPVKRRKAIAKIINKYNCWLIDDDVYGFLSPELPAISSFHPLRSFYLTSLSKSLFPGLRVGYITYPKGMQHRINAAIRNTVWMPSPLALALASKLIFSGQAKNIQEKQKEVSTRRQKLAVRIFKSFSLCAQKNSFHLWLSLPSKWTSESFSLVCKNNGVLVSSADSFNVNQQGINKNQEAIRLSLMSVKTDDELIFALNIIKKLLNTQ